MKKLTSLSFVLISTFLMLFSCQKNTEEKIVNQVDTFYLIDTIFATDTIQNFDTLFIYDTIIHTDTIVQIDTVIIQDTSEFSYLFKHYELERYEVLFYTRNKQKEPYKVCRMFSDAHQIEYLAEGHKIYPIWSQDSAKIIFVDLGLLAVVEQDIISGEIVKLYNIDRNIMFLKYFNKGNKFLVSYYEGGKSKIGAIDHLANEFIELTEGENDERNPTSSEVDDWIYFSRLNNGTYDIYRRKIDGQQEEKVYIDPEYNLNSFSVSVDGKFLITPKYSDGKGYVVFYDVERHNIIHELDLPVDGHPMYATLSRDNKAIFFVNGTPYNYSEPRNIYRMGLDKTQLFKMTNFTDKLASRPLVR